MFHQPYDGKVEFDVSREDALAMINFANSSQREFSPYVLVGGQANCKDFVRDTLKSGGIKTENATLPNIYFTNLVEGKGVEYGQPRNGSGTYLQQRNYWLDEIDSNNSY